MFFHVWRSRIVQTCSFFISSFIGSACIALIAYMQSFVLCVNCFSHPVVCVWFFFPILLSVCELFFHPVVRVILAHLIHFPYWIVLWSALCYNATHFCTSVFVLQNLSVCIHILLICVYMHCCTGFQARGNMSRDVVIVLNIALSSSIVSNFKSVYSLLALFSDSCLLVFYFFLI